MATIRNIGAKHTYNGVSRPAKKPRATVPSEKRRAREQELLQKDRNIEEAIDELIDYNNTVLKDLATKFSVSLSSLKIMMGQAGAEHNNRRDANPYNGWIHARMKEVNASESPIPLPVPSVFSC